MKHKKLNKKPNKNLNQRSSKKLNKKLNKKLIQKRPKKILLAKKAHYSLLLKENQKLQTFIYALNHSALVSATDRHGDIIYVNEKFCSVSGYTESELLGLDHRIMSSGVHQIHFFENLWKTITSRKVWNGEICNRKKDGSLYWSDTTIVPYFEGGEDPTQYISVRFDITARKDLEQKLRVSNQAAAVASQAKSVFLANMSHEIRTPMNSIIGMAELLLETYLTTEQKKFVDIFQRAGNNLLSIINDILDLSKIESGHFEIEKTDFDLDDVISRLSEIVAIRANEKKLELIFDISSEVPVFLNGDPNRLRQVLVNLLGNSIKFTAKGEVLLKIENDPHHPGELLFTIIDTGIGMSKDEMSRIFRAFGQADSSVTRNYGGSGLGLSISKQLVEAMGGGIRVESTKGQGTQFSFHLPFGHPIRPVQVVHQALPSLKGVKALIVDNSSTNRLILLKTLNSWSVQAISVEGGGLALSAIQESIVLNRPFDLILLDSRMPEMSGFELVKEMMTQLPDYKPILIMVTSEDRSGDLAQARSLGITSYLVKPIIRSSLYDAISRELGKKEIEKQPAKVMTSSLDEVLMNSRSLHILLVDDNEDNRMLILSYLKKSPFKIDVAENGKLALEKVQSGIVYDLIFMDMQMPVMDGLTATRLIREWQVGQGRTLIPIIALTANALKEEVNRSLEAGCNAHITKPIKKIVLLKTLIEYTG